MDSSYITISRTNFSMFFFSLAMLTIIKTCYFMVNLLRCSLILFTVFKARKNVYCILCVFFNCVWKRVDVCEEIQLAHQAWCYTAFISGFSTSEKCTVCDHFPAIAVYSAVTSWIHLLMFLVIVKNLSLPLSSPVYYG